VHSSSEQDLRQGESKIATSCRPGSLTGRRLNHRANRFAPHGRLSHLRPEHPQGGREVIRVPHVVPESRSFTRKERRRAARSGEIKRLSSF